MSGLRLRRAEVSLLLIDPLLRRGEGLMLLVAGQVVLLLLMLLLLYSLVPVLGLQPGAGWR